VAFIQNASILSAVDFFTAEYSRIDLIRAIEDKFQDYDAFLVPTTPTFPTI
jgi:Asp-tRNA(Asn)/Glu-tRNA(Gln) amidotransferase A subunit family amidase